MKQMSGWLYTLLRCTGLNDWFRSISIESLCDVTEAFNVYHNLEQAYHTQAMKMKDRTGAMR